MIKVVCGFTCGGLHVGDYDVGRENMSRMKKNNQIVLRGIRLVW